MTNDYLERLGAAARRVGVPAAWSLGAHQHAVARITVTVAIALTAVLPVAALMRGDGGGLSTRLTYATVRATNLGLGWSADASSAAAAQQQAVDALTALLAVAAFATLGIGAVTVLALHGARRQARDLEIAVSRAVGASRRTLLGAALIEGAALATGALLSGVVAAAAVSRAMVGGWPGTVQPAALAGAAFAAAALSGTMLVGAAFPILFARRRVREAAPAPVALRVAMAQLGLSLAVLTTGSLVARAVTEHPNTGGQPAPAGQLLRIDTAAPSVPAERAALYAALLERLHDAPGVGVASLTSPGTLLGLGGVRNVTTDCGACSDGGLRLPWRLKLATHQFVSADSFGALGMRVIAGRGIGTTDDWRGARVAVINRALAERHFQNGQAVGRGIKVDDGRGSWYTVVGVVDEPPPAGLGASLQPPYTVYLSILQHPARSLELLVRGSAGASWSLESLRSTVAETLGIAVTGIVAVPEGKVREDEAAPLAWVARWLTAEGAIMLLLAAGGTWLLMGTWGRSLRAELGLRRAVGAQRRDIVRHVLLRAGVTGIGGAVVGIWLAPAIWSGTNDAVSGLPSWDAAVLGRYALLLIAVALGGAVLPTLSAVRTAPAALLDSTPE